METKKINQPPFPIIEEIASKFSSSISVDLIKFSSDTVAVMKTGKKAFLMQNPSQYAQFKAEKEALTQLQHNSIIKFLNTMQNIENIYLVEELAEGVSLDKLLHIYQALPYPLVKCIIIQLLQTLNYMHSQHFIHRDIKASHIFLNEALRIHLIDFGFAIKTTEKLKHFCGTPHCMAPELLQLYLNDSCSGYDCGVDYYAVGVLMYELRIGQPPFGYVSFKGNETEAEKKQIYEDLYYREMKGKENMAGLENDEKDAILGLLEPNPEKRLKWENIGKLKYFAGLNSSAESYIDSIITGGPFADPVNFSTLCSDMSEFTSYIEVAGMTKTYKIGKETDFF